MSNQPQIAALWTGGWDSTYMIISLLRDGYEVTPVYIISPSRTSAKRELAALETLATLIKREHLPGHLLPLETHHLADIAPDPAITTSYQNLRREVLFGDQYEYIARLAAQHHVKYPYLALGLECPNGERSGCTDALARFGAFTQDAHDLKILDPEQSTPDLINIFGHIAFPIINLTETAMVANIRKWGLEHIMQHIWFCASPLEDDQPCGMCRPCQQKMECEMEWLLPEPAQARYHRSKGVLQYYIDNFTNLTPAKQFHFATHLKSWYHDDRYDNFLHEVATSTDLRDLLRDEGFTPITTDDPRHALLAKYPTLRPYERGLVHLHHFLYSCGVDRRAEFLQIVPASELYALSDALLADSAALSTLSTYAVNVICLIEELFHRDQHDPRNPRDQDILTTLYQRSANFQGDPTRLIYAYTHIILRDTHLFRRQIPADHRPLAEATLQRVAALLTTHYDDISLDAKLEFMACERLVYGRNQLSPHAPLHLRISRESKQSFHHHPYIIDPRRPDLADLSGSEHRNLLYSMVYLSIK